MNERYTTIAVGDVVSHRFTATDPFCEEFPPLICLFYRVTPAVDGVLELTITFTGNGAQPLDVSLWDPQFNRDVWWYPVRAPVKAGVTYQTTVWYGVPGGEFELRSALRQN